MENLSQLHFDALNAMMQGATSRAEQSFCALISGAIQSAEPIVSVLKIDTVSVELLHLENEKFGVVAQEITGSLNAQVMLVFSQKNVLRIVNTMLGEEFDFDTLPEVESDVMGELGNIIMNACVSSIADKLQALIESALPRYCVLSAEEIVTQVKNQQHKNYALVSHFQLDIAHRPLEGKLFLLFTVSELENLAI